MIFEYIIHDKISERYPFMKHFFWMEKAKIITKYSVFYKIEPNSL